MNELTITVSGQAGTGKSTIAQLISHALDREGFKFELVDDSIEGKVETTFMKRIRAIQENSPNIVIKTVQAPRG